MTTVIIQIGSNNLVHYHQPVPNAQPFLLEMDRALREWIRIPQTRFIINGILPRHYWEHQELFDNANANAGLEKLAGRQEFQSFVRFHPIQKAFIHYRGRCKGADQRTKLFRPDYIQLNADGHTRQNEYVFNTYEWNGKSKRNKVGIFHFF